MAGQAEGANVRLVALSAAFAYRENVVGIPKAFAGDGFQAPIGQHQLTAGPARTLQSSKCLHAVDVTDGADAAIACKYLLPEIAGVGAQTPFIHTPCGAESKSATRNFQRAPAAESAAAFASRHLLPNRLTARHDSLRAHAKGISCRCRPVCMRSSGSLHFAVCNKKDQDLMRDGSDLSTFINGSGKDQPAARSCHCVGISSTDCDRVDVVQPEWRKPARLLGLALMIADLAFQVYGIGDRRGKHEVQPIAFRATPIAAAAA